jgi:hypothetical protein
MAAGHRCVCLLQATVKLLTVDAAVNSRPWSLALKLLTTGGVGLAQHLHVTSFMLSKNLAFGVFGAFLLTLTLMAGPIIPVQLPMARPGSIPPTRKKLTAPLTQGANRMTRGQALTNMIQHLTPEQRKKLAKALKKMTPEERAQLLNSLSGRFGASGRGPSALQGLQGMK